MARQSKSLFEKVGRWERLSANLEPHLEDFPNLAELHTELDRIIAEVKRLDHEQTAQSSARQETVRLRRDLELLGERVSGRIGARLRSEHGFTSEKLVAFGLRPLKSRSRRPAPAPPVEPEPEEPSGPVLE